MAKKGYTELPPILPSAALEQAYAKQLHNMVKEMQLSVLYWVLAAYKKAPKLATDAANIPPRHETLMQRRRRARRENRLKKIRTAPETLDKDIEKLMERWEKKWDDFAAGVAEKYWTANEGQGRRAMEKAFKDYGFTVNMKMTAELKAVMESSVLEQVSLIRKIPRDYHSSIIGMVQRSFQNNMDIKTLTKDIKSAWKGHRPPRLSDSERSDGENERHNIPHAMRGIRNNRGRMAA